MWKLHVYGSSDDNFCWEVFQDGKRVDCDEHDDCANYTRRTIEVTSLVDEGVKMLVSGQYAQNDQGTWLIGVQPTDYVEDDEKLYPDWKISVVAAERNYSPMVVIESQMGFSVKLIDPEEED